MLIRGHLWASCSPCILPDGSNIAVLTRDFTDQKDHWAVLLVPVAGGEPRELIRVDAPEVLGPALACTRDGRGVLVQKNMPGGNELLLVPIEGGPPSKLDNSMLDFQRAQVSIHPDGKQVAYLSGDLKYEVCVLENFLPAK